MKIGRRRKVITLKVKCLDMSKLNNLEYWWLFFRARVLVLLGYGVLYTFPEMTNENAAEFESQYSVVSPDTGEFVAWKFLERELSAREVALDYNGEDIPD